MSEHPGLTNPPLTEVVCGVAFDSLSLSLAQIAELHHAMREDYPELSLQPAMPEHGEPFQFVIGPGAHTKLNERAWMESSDGVWLVQVQHNCLFVNWRQRDGLYPGMHAAAGVLEHFMDALAHFTALCGTVRPRRVEITKVNLLHQGLHWHHAEDLVGLLPLLQSLRAAQPGPELHFNISLNDHSMLPQHVLNARTVRRATPDGARLFVHLELSARYACDKFDAVRGALMQTNADLNDRFFSLIPEEHWMRFGGLIQ
jgi:uncharacterized protein (TIGR04255 family)